MNPNTPKRNQAIWWIVCVTMLFFCLSIGRLIDLMIVRGSTYRAQSDENRLFRVSVPATRGMIVDRTGRALTQNVPHYFLATSSAQLLFGNEWSLPDVPAEEALRYMVSSPSAVFIRPQRGDFVNESISHVVGYTGYISDIGPSGRPTQVRVGRTGIERASEKELAGIPGKEVLEISAKGVPQRSIVMESVAQTGKEVKLSIDLDLSTIAYEALQGNLGAVVVSDIETNQLLVLTSSPSYTIASLSSALSDPKKPLLNRALAAYPPGSTFKLMTALTALREKTITPETTIEDEGEIKLGQQVFGNWYWRQYGRKEGTLNVVRALARSNDIYFYKTAATVGPDKIDEIAQDFGYGKKTGIEISGDAVGVLPNSAWKEKVIGEKWYTGDTYNMGIGQGYILASPVQVNNMTATIARRGVLCPVTLLFQNSDACSENELDQAYYTTIIDGMVQACDPGGTAFPFFPLNEAASDEKKIACKTGTAEFGGGFGEKGYKRTHGWYTMFYPREKPLVAITVFVESSQERPFLEGSKDAAPVALKVFEEWKKKYEK